MRFVAAGFAAAGLLIAAPANAQQTIVIKFSHVVAADTPKGKGADYFKKLAEERTKGKVKVEVYPNSERYSDTEELEALRRGSVEMLAPSLAKFGPLSAREFEVFDPPYLFDNYEELKRVTQGPIGAGLLKGLASKGIVGLAFWDNGFKQMSANKPLRKIDDFRGLKMRVQASNILEAQMRALGALPEVIAFSDVFRGLETGVVDGTENPPSNFFTQRLQEVQKFMTLSDHGYLGYAVIVNKKFWDGLPSDLRAALESAMKDATAYANDIAKKENENALAAVRASGKTQILALSPEEKATWKKTLSAVHRQFEDKIGKDLVQAIYRETGYQP
ncbi:MAG: TRAP transporter substrate-binding protein [Burkholderiales bacterium]